LILCAQPATLPQLSQRFRRTAGGARWGQKTARCGACFGAKNSKSKPDFNCFEIIPRMLEQNTL
jgi:hypothetical protein